MFTVKELRKMIVPLLIEQFLAVSIGMIDSMMVSYAGEAAVSGVSLVDTFNLLLIYLFTALAGGGAVVISQLIGKNDLESANNSVKQLIWVVTSVAVLLSIVSIAFKGPILAFIFGAVDSDVMNNAQIYFLFTALSYPFLALYNGGAAVFRSMGNSKISMYASILMNIINVVGNAVLIFAFHLGAAGAAIATLISRIIGALVIIVLVHNKNNMIYLEKLFHFKPDFFIIKKICAIGIPNGLENSMFQFGKVVTQSLVATFGTMQIAANAVGNSIAAIQYIPGHAVGLTMITVIGRCVGAEEKEQAKKYALKLLGVTYGLIIAISVVMIAFLKPIIGFYNLSPESAELAYKLMVWHCVVVSVIWPSGFTLPNSFRAAGDVKYPMIMSISSMWVCRVGLSYLFGKYMNMGIEGIWLAMFCDWIFRAIWYVIRYIKGTWLSKV